MYNGAIASIRGVGSINIWGGGGTDVAIADGVVAAAS